MNESKTYRTPAKEEESLRIPDTNDFTPEQNSVFADISVDYKVKAIKLMKQVAESEVQNKKHLRQIHQLQAQTLNHKKQMGKIFIAFGVNNIQEVYRKVQLLLNGDKRVIGDSKLTEWSGIVQEYKKIINTQQYKYIKLEQQLKIAEVKLKKYEQVKEQEKDKSQTMSKFCGVEVKKLNDDLSKKQIQIRSLGQEVTLLKNQYKKVIIERDQIKDSYDELQNKYNSQIQHFQEIQKHVEERLVEVEKEMTYYRQERSEHLEKIQLMRKEINLKETKAYFSFGGVKHAEAQTDFEQDGPQFNNQFLEISTKMLLVENERLKNNLIMLYCKKPEEELPREVQFLLKILQQLRKNLIFNLVTIKIILMIEHIFILVQQQIELLVIVLNQILVIIFIDLHPLVFEVTNQSFHMTQVLRQTQKLNRINKLLPYARHLLRKVLTYFDENLVLFLEVYKQQLQTTDLRILVETVHVLVRNLCQHLVINFLELLQHLVEGRPLLSIIGQHIVGEVLPVGMKFTVILYPPLPDFAQMPLFLQIVEGLVSLMDTCTPWNNSF